MEKDAVYWMLSPSRALPLKPTPPPFRNHGNYVVSVAALSRWLAEKAEEAGAYLLTETSAHQLLVEDGAVRGIRSGDKGRGKDGEPLGNFEPGADVTARATVLAEGVWGHLTGAAIREFDLAADREPQVWALGVKEVWEVAKPLDRVIHTLGWPLRYGSKWHEFGGSWIYPMGEDRVSIGFVAGLDYTDATFSVHDVLQQFKTSKLVRKILEGGKRVDLGRQGDPRGRLLGDAQGLRSRDGHLRRQRRDGQRPDPQGHPLRDPLGDPRRRGDLRRAEAAGPRTSPPTSSAVEDSVIGQELYESRNMKQPFGRGFFVGGAISNAMVITQGPLPGRALGQPPRRRSRR